MDKIIRGLLADRAVNLIAITGKELCAEARRIHGLSRVCTAALGRTLMATVMMGAQLKGENHKVTAIVKGGGPAGNIVCTAGSSGRVKGYIENPSIELPPAPNGKLDVALAVGWFGELTVVKDLGLREPYVGRCDITSGEIAEDFARYFTLSEQQPSMIYLGVRLDTATGEVLSAGGLMAQPLPHCPDEALDELQRRAEEVQKLSRMLEEGMSLPGALEEIFAGMDLRLTGELTPELKCDCSRERLERVLLSLGEAELMDMMEKEHGAELSCHFCGSVYAFDEGQLAALLAEAREGREE